MRKDSRMCVKRSLDYSLFCALIVFLLLITLMELEHIPIYEIIQESTIDSALSPAKEFPKIIVILTLNALLLRLFSISHPLLAFC